MPLKNREKPDRRAYVDMPYDVRDKDAEMRVATSYVPRKSSRNGATVFNITVFLLVFGVVLLAARAVAGGVGILEISLAFVCALLAVSSVHIALSWERVVVLRMGKLSRVAGPGLYFTIPILEHGTIRVDQRTIATPFYAEKTLTADLVPVTVDAVLFWMVWNAEKACIEVEDYYAAVSFLAQTAMREAVGRSTVAEVALRRDQLDQEIKEEVEREAAAWGIGVISVKVRDIVIPDDLQHVMSLEAQADREKNARMTVASAEADMADMLAEAASAYGDPSAALRLRTILQQYETVKVSKGTVVTVPSALSDSLADAIDKEGQR